MGKSNDQPNAAAFMAITNGGRNRPAPGARRRMAKAGYFASRCKGGLKGPSTDTLNDAGQHLSHWWRGTTEHCICDGAGHLMGRYNNRTIGGVDAEETLRVGRPAGRRAVPGRAVLHYA
jgi:hypothetical protein